MDIGDKVRFRGTSGYEVVGKTEDGRLIVDGVLPSNLLEHQPFTVAADDNRLLKEER